MQRLLALILLGSLLAAAAVAATASTAHACSIMPSTEPTATPAPASVPGDGTPLSHMRFPRDPTAAIELLTAGDEPVIIGAMRLTTVQSVGYRAVQVVDGLWGDTGSLESPDFVPTSHADLFSTLPTPDRMHQADPLVPSRHPIQVTPSVDSCSGPFRTGLSSWVLVGPSGNRTVEMSSRLDGAIWFDGLTKLLGEPDVVELGEYAELVVEAKKSAPSTYGRSLPATPAAAQPVSTDTTTAVVLGVTFGIPAVAVVAARASKRKRSRTADWSLLE